MSVIILLLHDQREIILDNLKSILNTLCSHHFYFLSQHLHPEILSPTKHFQIFYSVVQTLFQAFSIEQLTKQSLCSHTLYILKWRPTDEQSAIGYDGC